MSLIRIQRPVVSKVFRCFATAPESEYTSSPQYPPILDLSCEKRAERKKNAVHDEIEALKTVEEKQIKLNMPKYYGFNCYMFNENLVPYNGLPMVQHITRTHLIESPSFPPFYKQIDVDGVCEKIGREVEEILLMQDKCSQDYEVDKTVLSEQEKEDRLSNIIVKQINRSILNGLSDTFEHTNGLEIDYDTRIESSWFAGGMNPPISVKKFRTNREWLKHTENDPVDRPIQYLGESAVTLRAELPLDPIIPFGEAENPAFQVPFFKFDPRVLAITRKHRHLTNIPGYWPGEEKQFGILSFNNRGHLKIRPYNDEEESKEAIHYQGILASFGWLNAQANMLGFTTFNDVTYPIVSQLVVTNGQLWSFYIYQMNSLLIHSKHTTENKKRNVCWATPELKLFEEIKDGKMIGFNPDVLKMLIQMYANAPQERLGANLRPYLGKEEKTIADYSDEDKRQWLEREYKYLMSNRGRHKLPYELYNWEKIYKVDHQTRFMEKRRRPFELGYKQTDRRLDQRLPAYIPRALRPDLPRHKGRYAKEYFP